MDVSDSIPKNHVARTVSTLVDGIDRQIFLEVYKGGDPPAYDPWMMTKILFYAYTQKWYSCCQITRTLRENLLIMWPASPADTGFSDDSAISRAPDGHLSPDLTAQLFLQVM
jgi:transposase